MNYNLNSTKNTLLIICIFYANLVTTLSENENKMRKHFLAPEIDTLPISNWTNPTFENYKLIESHLRTNFIQGIKKHSQTGHLPISNWSDPTDQDLEILYKHLAINLTKTDTQPAPCPEFQQIKDYICWWIIMRLGRFKIIDTKENPPIFNAIYFNNDPEKKDKCVVCYVGYKTPGEQRDYTKGLQCMIKALKAIHFDGHFIYRIGGWPNVQKGRLKYADVPYGFKPFFIEEVKDMGYKQILWLDAAAIPVRSLNPIFNHIQKHGCCFFAQGTISDRNLNDRSCIMASLGFTKKKKQYPSIITSIIGFNFADKSASHLFDRWIQAAEKKVPFLSPDADQFSLCLLINELNMLKGQLPAKYYMSANKSGNFIDWKQHRNCIIYHQYDFLNPKYHISDNLFGEIS